MAGWSILGNGCALDYLEILQNLQNNGFCLDLDVNSLKISNDASKENKLRDMFDQILCVFLKEFSVSGSIRPLPAVLGDGKCVDLFKLFWVVREKGGYDSVSKSLQWGLVAEEIGLTSEAASSVKLFYFKYLDILDRWLRGLFRVNGKGGGVGVDECDTNLGLLPVGLKTQFKDFLCNIPDQNRVNEEHSNGNQVSSSGDACNKNALEGVPELGNAEKHAGNGNKDVMIVDKIVVNQEVYSRKRKRGTLSEMLNWLSKIAKNHSEAAVGKSDDASKQKECRGPEFRSLILLARKELIQSRNVYWTEPKENPHWQKKQKMHPSMYEEGQVAVDLLSMERLRCSPRIVAQKNGNFDPEHESSDMDIGATPHAGTGNGQARSLFDDVQIRKRVPLGALFQAEVPEWTGVSSESDSKWLGTVVWPLIAEEQYKLAGKSPIGKGRRDSCDCRLPGSVECVRFHIAEKRMKLKYELGIVFYAWRFHCMGEEVSLSWTEEEEKKFKTIVRLNPRSLDKFFWNQLYRCFRSKSCKSLVSYYFNVFVLQRRAYQNRVTPNNIDSDDDESEFGSLSDRFGHAAVKILGSKSISCVHNYQCIDVTDVQIRNQGTS